MKISIDNIQRQKDSLKGVLFTTDPYNGIVYQFIDCLIPANGKAKGFIKAIPIYNSVLDVEVKGCKATTIDPSTFKNIVAYRKLRLAKSYRNIVTLMTLQERAELMEVLIDTMASINEAEVIGEYVFRYYEDEDSQLYNFIRYIVDKAEGYTKREGREYSYT